MLTNLKFIKKIVKSNSIKKNKIIGHKGFRLQLNILNPKPFNPNNFSVDVEKLPWLEEQ